ncbi:Golgi resident protein GCP60 isoform X2 [Chanodichthys erythropterus]|uniref:Golgi resident protein GCP60 isoform X2 n=1 Tax=Megalobrama amblycephala TaxID=75352 RepID=UPI00201445F3|nr:Golgi resident protein GCP60 isoform X2 [Megalobrama amblycephala]
MATEVQSGDLNSANSSRLEVSIDGLTLSPDSEGEQEQAETPAARPADQSADNPLSVDGEEGEPANSGTIEKKWGFDLVELYGLALRFFKEKDGKAFHPTYEDKLRLVALHKQVLQGPYNPDASPEVGFFDVLGNDRRREWASLGNMEKDEAMLEFVKLLNKCCNLFAPFVASHKIEKEEQERKRREEEERRRREEEERERLRQEEERRRREEEERLRREEEERRQVEEERLRVEQQKQQIMAALNAQTAVQFQQYAAQQYPDSPEQQLILIRQLQEQHYQQYMQQLYQVQLAQQQAALQKQQEDAIVLSTLEASEVSAPSSGEEAPTLNGQAESTADSLEREPDLEPADEVTENGPTDSPPVIAAPSMWTRPQIKDFKEKIRQDVDSVITVGRGEVVTVRVPTHEEGSYLFWEFATDYYDIGFGVFFEWTDSTNASVSVHVSESSDEDEDEEGEGQSEEDKAKKETGKPQVDEIVPVYRRDCHEEVYAGSHQYPGRGIYLLKFDNSYSLWRSKTVYYRVYYTR